MPSTELALIIKDIISSEGIQENVNAVKKLSDFYNRATADTDTFDLSPDNEKYVKGGQALSTYHAAVCTDDYMRTCYFLKGIYKAVIKLISDFPEKKINILYAGCGPFATLLLPLLPLLKANTVEAIILDINSSSLQSVKKLISILQLEDYSLTLIETDATAYQKPKGWDIDLFISETMHYGLTAEPQVAITKNFIPQLTPHTIFIPEQIHIDLVYTFYSKEPFIKFKQDPNLTTKLQPEPPRLFIDRLFSIGKNSAYILGRNQIITEFYPVPDDIHTYPDLCVFTEIEIFDGIVLRTAESVLTNPYCVISLFHLKAHSEFQLVYDYSETPKWAYRFR
jgi:hypothetical protein